MSRIGIFGGNFNPVHHGHLITAVKIYELRGLDKVIFLPAFISPFKKDERSTAADHRMNMLNLAIEEVPFFESSDYEIKAGGISFTIDTLRGIKDRYENIELIIGYDNLLEFERWKEPDEIAKLAKLIVLRRGGERKDNPANRFFDKAYFADTPSIQISSTEIRERVKNNLSIDYLVPQRVKEYIYTNNLYKE